MLNMNTTKENKIVKIANQLIKKWKKMKKIKDFLKHSIEVQAFDNLIHLL